MRPKAAMTSLLLLILSFALTAPAQSLGDLAKKEKERREKVKSGAKVITNDDTAKYAAGAVTTSSLPAPPPQKGPEASQADGTAPQGADPNEPTDLQGRPESFWRQTFADARSKVSELENEANVLVLKVNELQNRFYNTDDGFQRQAVQRELQKTLYQQDQNKQDLAKAKAVLEELEKEARKSGALPGWIESPRKP